MGTDISKTIATEPEEDEKNVLESSDDSVDKAMDEIDTAEVKSDEAPKYALFHKYEELESRKDEMEASKYALFYKPEETKEEKIEASKYALFSKPNEIEASKYALFYKPEDSKEEKIEASKYALFSKPEEIEASKYVLFYKPEESKEEEIEASKYALFNKPEESKKEDTDPATTSSYYSTFSCFTLLFKVDEEDNAAAVEEKVDLSDKDGSAIKEETTVTTKTESNEMPPKTKEDNNVDAYSEVADEDKETSPKKVKDDEEAVKDEDELIPDKTDIDEVNMNSWNKKK